MSPHRSPLRSYSVVIAAVAVMLSGGPELHAENLDQLDRGHRILIQRGLQIQALTFGTSPGDWWDNWDSSNFTTPSFQGRSPVGQGIAPGDPWVSWIGNLADPANSIPTEALPYLPGLISWTFRDELDLNDPQNRAKVKTWLEAYEPQLPNTLLHTSEYGAQVTVDNMRTYMAQAQPDMVHFDAYPFRNDSAAPIGGSPWYLYRYMDKYRDLGLAGNDGTGNTPIPYGMWLQTFRFARYSDDSTEHMYWLPSESEMRLSQFAAWTFGYKVLSAFTYNDVHEDPFVYIDSPLFDGPVHTTQDPTAEFDRYAETNRQSLNLGNTLTRLLSTDVRLIIGGAWDSSVQAETRTLIPLWDANAEEIPSYPYITAITAQNLGTLNSGLNGDVLVGYFKPLLEEFDGPAFENEIYFMITNGLSARDALVSETRQRITIDFDFGTSDIDSLQRLSRDTGQVEVVSLQSVGGSHYRLELELDGGTGDLFKFNTGAPFVSSSSSSRIPGDANGDGIVDDLDLTALATHWMQPGDWADGDFTGNGFVSDFDLTILAMAWPSAGLDTSAIPEPCTLGLLLPGYAAAALRKRSQVVSRQGNRERRE